MRADLGSALVALIALHVLAVLCFVVVRRPQRGVLLLAALVPFDGLLILVPDVGLLAGWKEALVLLVLAATFAAPASARRGSRQPLPSWTLPLVGLVLIGAVSALAVGGTQAVVGLKLNFFYVLLFAALFRCPLSSRERDHLITIVMAVGVLTAVVGLWQQVIGGDALNRLGYEYDETIRTAGGLLRSFSTFNQPFPFGFYMMLVLLLGLPVAAADPRRVRNWLFLACVPLLVLGMVSSIVRAAVAGFLVGALFLWLHRYRALAHLVPPTLAALLFVPPGALATLLSSSSLAERGTGWVQTAGRVLGAPLGNGIGSTGSASEKAAELAGRASAGYQPDNYYFKTAYELGPVGLWLLVLLLVGVFAWARTISGELQRGADAVEPRRGAGGRQQQRAVRAVMEQDAALAAGTAAMVLAAATASVVATYFEIFPLDVYFWLLLGVVTSLPTSPSAPLPCAREAVASRPTSGSSSVP